MINKTTMISTALCISLLLSSGTQSSGTDKIGIVIECESISKLLDDITAVSETLKLPFQKTKIELVLANMFASPSLAGISSNQPFQACMVIKQIETNPNQAGLQAPGKSFVLVLPLTDNGDNYLKSAGKAYGKSEKVNTITHLSLYAGEKPGSKPDLYIGISSGKAVVGADAANVEFILSSLNNLFTWKAGFAAVSGTIRVGIDIAAVTPPLECTLQQFTAMLKQMPPPAQTPEMSVKTNPAQIMSAEGELLLAIMKQLKTYTLGIGIKKKTIEINTLLAPAQEGQLAALMSNLTPPSEKYLSAMPANAFITSAGNGMNIIDIFVEPYSVMMEKIFSAIGQDSTKAGAQMKELMLSMKGAFSGEYTIGVVPGAIPKDIALVEMIGVKDPAKFRKTILDGIATTSAVYSNLIPGMSMTLGKSRISSGVEVIPYTVSYKPSSNTTPQAAMMTMGLFQNYKAEITFVGNDVIYAMGGGPAIMDMALARLKTGGTRVDTSKIFTSLFPQAPAKMVSVQSFELVKLIKALLATMPNGEQILLLIPDTNSGIAGYSTLKGSDLITTTRIGLDEIAGIKNALPALGMMLMPMIMAANPQAGAAPGGSDARCINNLRMLDAAKEQAALEKGMKNGDNVDPSSIVKYLLRGKMPVCPAGGIYLLNPIGKSPTCSIPSHVLK
ncbi:MAG: hypothetical protein PHR77_06260 [Kiritimatiellae bacterium]|nr:hypothetical protein [Kiritimatiellia bacterium]MDD5521511.1 hypothetical protein [Kiritimatiellia bacterium]